MREKKMGGEKKTSDKSVVFLSIVTTAFYVHNVKDRYADKNLSCK
jgi:hypothetical protein